jgi:hypothetical protein
VKSRNLLDAACVTAGLRPMGGDDSGYAGCLNSATLKVCDSAPELTISVRLAD